MPYCNNLGVKIYYEVSGEGYPFVLVHANPFDHDLWLYQRAHFSTFFKMIVVDIRGYGRSDKVLKKFSLSEMASDVIAVCKAEGVEKAILGGCSVGSGMALSLGLDFPEKFEVLILVGGQSDRPNTYDAHIEGYSKIGPSKYQIGHLRSCVTNEFYKTKLGDYLLKIFHQRAQFLDGSAIARVFEARGAADLTTRLHQIRIPTLVINGEFDQSLKAGMVTAKLIPDARHCVLPKTGHACNLEDPAGFDSLVSKFLKENNLIKNSVA